jgi:DJ-1 family protein
MNLYKKYHKEITMDIKALVPIAQGTEDAEAVIIIDLLRRAGISVKVAGENQIVTCARGMKMIPDMTLYQLEDVMRFEAVVIPGGSEGVDNLSDNERLASLVPVLASKGALIGAVCAAPLVLDAFKILKPETRLTSHPSVRMHLDKKYQYSEESVVVDGRIVTSRGIGTTIPFTLKIIEILAGKQTSDKIASDIIYSWM